MNCKKTSLTLGMVTALAIGITIVFASPLSATTVMAEDGGMMTSSSSPSPSYSLQQPGGISAQSGAIKPGIYARGTIASLQNDKDGKPAWIVSGLWRGTITNTTASSGAAAMSSTASNTTTTSEKNQSNITFNAIFDMVRLNGSAWHTHQISNFSVTSMTPPDQKANVYNGTATITMKDGPVNGVPISIRTLNHNVQSIWVDPTKTMNHFGNTPIYGTITQDVTVTK